MNPLNVSPDGNAVPSSNPAAPTVAGRCPRCREIMLSRHCIACGFSRPEARPLEPSTAVDPAREACDNANRNALVALCESYPIRIPSRGFDLWRPTQRVSGTIPGFDRNLVILCTDGIIAWFLCDDGSLFHGHVHLFSGDVLPLHSVGTPKAIPIRDSKGKPVRKRKEKPKAKTAIDIAFELLQKLTQPEP